MFKEKLGAVSVKQLSRTAKDRRSGSLGYAEAMVIEYNGRKKNSNFRLVMNKLYAKELSFIVEPCDEELEEQEMQIEFPDDEIGEQDDVS